jgi:ADP-heptose:LPS heptosyltransferase
MESLRPEGNLIVTLFNGFGDVFLALPVLREIGRRFARCKVYLATYSECADLFFRDFDFKFLRPICPPNNEHMIVALRDDLESLDIQQSVSLNYYVPNSVDMELACLHPSLPRKAFFDVAGNRLVLRGGRHMRDLYFDVPGWEPRYSLLDRQVFIPPEHIEKFSFLHRRWVSENGERVYALHLDTNHRKMWSVEKWIEVVSHIWLRWKAWPIVLGKETESSLRLQQVFSFVRKLSCETMATHFAAVKLADVFVGIDSIFAHVADSYSKPMAVLYGPTDLSLWGALSPEAFVITPDDGTEMKRISANKVISAVDRALDYAYGTRFDQCRLSLGPTLGETRASTNQDILSAQPPRC